MLSYHVSLSFLTFGAIWLLDATVAAGQPLKCIMYLTGQHNVVPEISQVADITHVALAFMRSEIFNDAGRQDWPLFTSVNEVRAKFAPNTVVQVAVGGWGDTAGFEQAALTKESRDLFARNVKAMLDATGADGIDMDWEYPGGNGEDYKTRPNSGKTWQIDAYPELLSSIRDAIGPSKVISAAVPGLERDMIAFTASTIPKIIESVDFLNIMTYDLMNRRDNVTKHHTGLEASIASIKTYVSRGVPPGKANLGLAFYIKWFRTAEGVDCSAQPLGCKTMLMEDPGTGVDLGQAGAFSWHDTVPNELKQSFDKAMREGKYDDVGGGQYFWDEAERLFWSWDSPDGIKKKVGAVVGEGGLVGGVFAWALGEDGNEWVHLKAATDAMGRVKNGSGYKSGAARRDEL